MQHSELVAAALALCGPMAYAAGDAAFSGNTLHIPHVLYKEAMYEVSMTFQAPDKLILDEATLLTAKPDMPEVKVPDELSFSLGEIDVDGKLYRADLVPVVKGESAEFKASSVIPSYHGKMFKGQVITALGVLQDNGAGLADDISDDGKTIASQTLKVKEEKWVPVRINLATESFAALNGLPDGIDGWPVAANNNGAIAGHDYIDLTPDIKDDSLYKFLAFYNKSGVDMVNIGTLGQGVESFGLGVNNKEIVVGWSQTTADRKGHTAFMYDANTQKLSALTGGVLTGQLSFAFAINDAGQIAGVTTTAEGQSLAFVYQNGQTKTLGALDNSGYSEARGINQKGVVTGFSATTAGTLVAFIHDGTSMVKIPEIPDQLESKGKDINIQGQVVGSYTDKEGKEKPFLYKDGKAADLYSLLPAEDRANWKELFSANGISDDGTIVGIGNFYIDKANDKTVQMGYRLKL